MLVKRFTLIILVSLATVFIFYLTAIDNFVTAYPDGITGQTGSPSTGGSNCSSCHLVGSTSKTDRITLTNDIPMTGYVPNVTYHFTLNFLSKRSRAGFNVRLEDAKGEVAGILKSLDTLTRTEGGELTHTFHSIIDNGKGEFKFTWTAPSTGDTVKLFAMAATSPRNGTLDTLNSFEYVFRSAFSTSLQEENISATHLAVAYHQENVRITYTLKRTSQVQMSLYGTTGVLVKTLYEGTTPQGEHDISVPVPSLKKGLYMAHIVINGKRITKKILIGE